MSEIQKLAERMVQRPGAAAATKRVRVCLSALTRLEYSEVVTVPAETTEAELDDLVKAAYEEVDGSLFSEDVEYWEKGTCRHEDA